MDLWCARRGSQVRPGTGINFSKLRSSNEKLSGGGRSSGLMSFLKIAIAQPAPTSRRHARGRAAKMVVVDVDTTQRTSRIINWKCAMSRMTPRSHRLQIYQKRLRP